MSSSFLGGYLETADGASILPADPAQVRLLLDALVLEKAAYELEYEINNRPDWVEIPLRGILDTLP
jgi:maltose alpha-D-glucosyltransferase/alpha-amylase